MTQNATSTAGNGGRDEPCKGCSASVHITDAQLKRILDALDADPEQCVDDELYAERLNICRSCPALAYETTCRICGCLVAVRAKLKDKACPFPGQAKW